MNILQKAMLLTEANIVSQKSSLAKVKENRKVAFKCNDKINYLIPSNMKIKSFNNMVVKNEDLINKLENSDYFSINLK